MTTELSIIERDSSFNLFQHYKRVRQKVNLKPRFSHENQTKTDRLLGGTTITAVP